MYHTNNSSLFLAGTVPVFVAIILAALIVVVGVAAFLVGRFLYKKLVAGKIADAEQTIKIMREEAESECRALKKEAILEAKEQDLKLRNEFERETKEKKSELAKAEQRLMQKEDMLDKKEDSLLKK